MTPISFYILVTDINFEAPRDALNSCQWNKRNKFITDSIGPPFNIGKSQCPKQPDDRKYLADLTDVHSSYN
jgi:hypothetical protein